MIDVIEQTKVAPADCTYGCADWTGTDSLWHGGKVPSAASNYCAQPGATVNDRTLGAWCICANKTEDTTKAGFSLASTPSSISNKAFFLENIGSAPKDPSNGEWVSFTGSNVLLYDKSEKLKGGAAPWVMLPIDDDPNVMTFYIQNVWRCPSEARCGEWHRTRKDLCFVLCV